MKSIQEDFKELSIRAWTTAGSRYNAFRRIQARSRLSTITIALLSGVGIIVPVLSAASTICISKDGLAVYSAILSMIIFVVGVIEGSSDFGVQSASLFQSAEELNKFQASVLLKMKREDVKQEMLERLLEQYEEIKRKCQYNHHPVDYRLFLSQHHQSSEFSKNEFRKMAWWHRAWANVHYSMHSRWWMISLWIVAMAGFLLLI
ncbi:SLATT domain-containing protein [Xanthomonas graminis]|uniref:SLATT domain-containing protein n=1 Tax=Xanthomonas graminis TaxID=3390026 RepID=UPI000A553054|nr:SLATT domain-containing protein [Xanthomonas translucens]UKE77845.1 SLATT domain-containing protein [Xanthomonas translucens pv. arrhenatheri]